MQDPATSAFYLATSHPLDPLWWWDGAGTCHPTGLGTLPAGTRSPAYAVAVDPTDRRRVWVGTTIGVWEGELTLPGPSWRWRRYGNGLPEAAAQDLALDSWPRPGGGTLRLLRVAVQARGLFEVDVDASAAPATFLRVHAHDTRRLRPTPLADPLHLPAQPRRTWPTGPAPATATTAPAPVSVAPGAVPRPAGLPWVSLPPDRFWLWSLQTAVRALDPAVPRDAPLVVADGRWTAWWVQRLRRVRTALGLPNPGAATVARVDGALWVDARVQAGFWTPPWADGGPTEADLVERVVGRATNRTGGLTARATRAASFGALRRRAVVDVLVHRRGQGVRASDVAVVLLQAPLGIPAGGWAATAVPDVAGLAAALDALPAGGGTPTGWAPGGQWAFADAGRPASRPTSDVGPGSPSVVSLDVDLSAVAAGSDVLLLALVHTRGDPVALPAGGVRDAVLESSHAAARSVHVS